MTDYTSRFTHLEKTPGYRVGDIVRRGDVIGRMGNSGQSTAPHLHLDCVMGHTKEVYRLSEIELGYYIPAPKQCLLFVDNELFGVPVVITTGYAEPLYYWELGKVHYGFDVVPYNRHETKDNFAIHWNRSCEGVVLAVGYDKGYGHYIQIGFRI